MACEDKELVKMEVRIREIEIDSLRWKSYVHKTR